jgi:hypothetical protein
MLFTFFYLWRVDFLEIGLGHLCLLLIDLPILLEDPLRDRADLGVTLHLQLILFANLIGYCSLIS